MIRCSVSSLADKIVGEAAVHGGGSAGLKSN